MILIIPSVHCSRAAYLKTFLPNSVITEGAGYIDFDFYTYTVLYVHRRVSKLLFVKHFLKPQLQSASQFIIECITVRGMKIASKNTIHETETDI